MSPRQITETAYMAASTGLLWVAIYYLPIGDALFRLAIPLPLALLQLRQGSRTAVEGVAVSVLLLTVLMGPVRGPLMLFPYGTQMEVKYHLLGFMIIHPIFIHMIFHQIN